MFVPDFKILGRIVPEKSLMKKKYYTHTDKHCYGKDKNVYTCIPIYFIWQGYKEKLVPFFKVFGMILPGTENRVYQLPYLLYVFWQTVWVNSLDQDEMLQNAASHNNLLSLPLIQQCLGTTMGSLFVCVEVLRPSQPNGVMSSAVNLPNHTFTG